MRLLVIEHNQTESMVAAVRATASSGGAGLRTSRLRAFATPETGEIVRAG